MPACLLVLLGNIGAAAETRPTVPLVTLSFDRQLGPLAIDHIALGQGGLSADSMFHSRVADVRALLVWNFSPQPVEFELAVEGLPGPLLRRQITLDATAPSDNENARLRPEPPLRVPAPPPRQRVRLEPFGVRFWSFE